MPTLQNIEIANDFFHDSLDLLHRYRLTIDHFDSIKSKRFKLFLDLRMATECILKAYAAYFLMKELPRKEVINRVEGFGHKIKKMAEIVEGSVKNEVWEKFSPFVEQLEFLPVGLRYRLDGMDFRQVNEAFYYKTIGSNLWLNALHDATKKLADELNQYLVTHSRLLSGKELLDEIRKPFHNKYAKREVK